MLDSVSIAVSIGAAVLSPCIQVLLDQIVPNFMRRFGPKGDPKEELRSLERTLLKIQALLADVEMAAIKDRSSVLWLMELKGAAYDMEDVLDEFATTILSQVSPPPSAEIVRGCLEKIEKSRNKLDEIVKERHFLNWGKSEGPIEGLGSSEERITSSFVNTSRVVGRNPDKDYVIENYLCMDSESEPCQLLPVPLSCQSEHLDGKDLPVLPIVGMGGIGKTTLAQLVYNDRRVKAYFSLRMWVCVSDNFDVKRIFREILESASGGTPCALTNWDTIQIQCSLKRKLQKQKFLLVLDDMWCEDCDEWEMLYASLLHGKKGSKVIITRRDGNVDKFMGMLSPYELKRLSPDHSWLLFRKCAFPSGSLEEYPKLEEIGRKIVQKLNGSPLAVKTIGCLLKSKPKESTWKNILESEMWELQQDKNDILPILRLSYQHLPANLKLCFVSCSIFSRGYKFDKQKLIQIWMAQGLIHNQGKRLMEDIGSEYFDDLCSRSFFHKSEDPIEKNKYVIHELMHDMAKFVSLDEFCTLGDDLTPKIPESVRHISLTCTNILDSHFSSLYELKSLRILLFLHRNKSNFVDIPDTLFDNLQYIRVLDLSGSNVKVIPDSLDKLKHLRFLDLSNMASLCNLPVPVTTLYNLQTLRLLGSKCLSNLPKGMSNLINLRHLEADSNLATKVAKIGNLTSLQKLELFIVQKEDGFEIQELKGLSQLHGCLSICKVENVKETDVTDQFIMSNKEHLDTLELKWEGTDNGTMSMDHHHCVFEGLRPHSNLKGLIIYGYGGKESPTWMIRKDKDFLCNLETVHLSKCRSWKKLPPLGELQFLKSLEIKQMDGLEEIDHKYFGTFPSLRKLQFSSMAKWNRWSGGGLLLFSSLEELVIESCPKLKELPPLSSTLSVLKINKVGLGSLPETRSCRQDGGTTPALSKLNISDCPNLTSLSQLQQLVALETLTLTGCEALTSTPDGWFGNLTSLKSLTLEECPHLAFSPQGSNGLPSSLGSLYIDDCPGLVSQPLWEALRSATAFQNLTVSYHEGDSDPDESTLTVTSRELEIHCSSHPQGNPLMNCLQNLTSICHLSIKGCSTITTLSGDALHQLTELKYMEIVSCKELATFEFQSLSSLKSLRVVDCPKLRTCLPSGGPQVSGAVSLSPLESLEIVNSSLFAADLCNLTSLQKLTLQRCAKFTPKEEQWLATLTSLQTLRIIKCNDMVSLPSELQNFQRLGYLCLMDCPAVQISVTQLPTSLRDVIISGCTSLMDHCKTANWPSHIRSIIIDRIDI